MVANWKEISESGRILIERGCAYFCNSRSDAGRALSASYNGSELDEILKYDKRSKIWIPAGRMKERRYDHAVAVLKDVSQLCP